jgi:hypothetical protein
MVARDLIAYLSNKSTYFQRKKDGSTGFIQPVRLTA